MRLTKFNPETGQYEYKEPAKTQEEFIAQRKAVIQRIGEIEDQIEQGTLAEVVRCRDCVYFNQTHPCSGICKEHGVSFNVNDYCRYGIRRDE